MSGAGPVTHGTSPYRRGTARDRRPGSYLVIAHGSSTSEGLREAARRYRDSGADPYPLRGPDQLARFFEGLEVVPPGLVPVPQWRPDPASRQARQDAFSYCAVGRKPS